MKISAYISEAKGARFSPERSGSGIYMWADSCWLLSDRPLYIPDFAERFIAIPALAVKSSRLGKAISKRFSLRYIGQWTAALILLPAEAEHDFQSGNTIDTADICFDNAIVLGHWQESSPLPSPLPLEKDAPAAAAAMLPDSLTVAVLSPPALPTADPAERQKWQVNVDPSEWPEAIARISAFNVVKTGDITLFPSDISIPLRAGLTIRILDSTEEIPLLSTKFK